MLFKEIITVYTENQNPWIQNAQLIAAKASGTYSYHWALMK
jgi:hypothetical protein